MPRLRRIRIGYLQTIDHPSRTHHGTPITTRHTERRHHQHAGHGQLFCRSPERPDSAVESHTHTEHTDAARDSAVRGRHRRGHRSGHVRHARRPRRRTVHAVGRGSRAGQGLGRWRGLRGVLLLRVLVERKDGRAQRSDHGAGAGGPAGLQTTVARRWNTDRNLRSEHRRIHLAESSERARAAYQAEAAARSRREEHNAYGPRHPGHDRHDSTRYATGRRPDGCAETRVHPEVNFDGANAEAGFGFRSAETEAAGRVETDADACSCTKTHSGDTGSEIEARPCSAEAEANAEARSPKAGRSADPRQAGRDPAQGAGRPDGADSPRYGYRCAVPQRRSPSDHASRTAGMAGRDGRPAGFGHHRARRRRSIIHTDIRRRCNGHGSVSRQARSRD